MRITLLRLKTVAATLACLVLLAAPYPSAADDTRTTPPPLKKTGEETDAKAESKAAPSETGAADKEETEAEAKASPDCEDVQITVQNTSGQAVKLISVDYAAGRRWTRGKIVFRTIDDGGAHVWTGSLKDLAGKEVRFRVNTRTILDAMTDRYSDLQATLVTSAACASAETHLVTIGE